LSIFFLSLAIIHLIYKCSSNTRAILCNKIVLQKTVTINAGFSSNQAESKAG
jgi:hypothetical protein